MAQAKKLPSGNWRVRAYDKANKKYKSFTAETKKEAELMALEWLNGKQIKHSDLTFGNCIDDYISSKENILSPSTIDSYRRISRNSLNELREYRLADLNQDAVQRHFKICAT